MTKTGKPILTTVDGKLQIIQHGDTFKVNRVADSRTGYVNIGEARSLPQAEKMVGDAAAVKGTGTAGTAGGKGAAGVGGSAGRGRGVEGTAAGKAGEPAAVGARKTGEGVPAGKAIEAGDDRFREGLVGEEGKGVESASDDFLDGLRGREGTRTEANTLTGKEGIDSLYRGDSFLYSEKSVDGTSKSYINPSGDLVPANVKGIYKVREVSITEHILGGFRRGAKGNSPYTSFTNDNGIAATYGNSVVKVDLNKLYGDIAAGKVNGVEILTPKQVQDMIISDVRFSKHWRDMALKWARRDNEYLVKA